jgi:hypothetical protein
MTDNPQTGLTDDELAAQEGEELPQREQMSLIDPGAAGALSGVDLAGHIQPHPPSTLPVEPPQ